MKSKTNHEAPLLPATSSQGKMVSRQLKLAIETQITSLINSKESKQ